MLKSFIPRQNGYYDTHGKWQRTKFCFTDCGQNCTCKPPNGQFYCADIEYFWQQKFPHMSFAMTTQQILDESKDVTRRFGWWKLKPGRRIWAVEKAMGLKKGEKVKKLKLIECINTRTERLCDITNEDVIREGFPDKSAEWFVKMIVDHYKCKRWDMINRIEFRYIDSI